MAKIKFIATTIKNLQPQSTSKEYFEAGRNYGEGAFGVRVSPKGKKTWFVMYENSQKKIKRYTLGQYPALSLKDARAKLNDVMAKVNDDKDPMSEKSAKKKAPTMNDLWEEYQQSLNRRKTSKAASTVREEERKWKVDIEPILGGMKVEDVKRSRISELLNNKANTSPVAANRIHSLLSMMFKTALNLGWIEIHPMYMMSKPGGQEEPRKKILIDDDIRTIWPCFNKLRSNPRDIMKLVLLTAQRPGEIMSMRWEDIDLEKLIWTLHDTKNKATHLVPLSDQVVEIIKARNQDSEWVFPSNYNIAKGAKTGHAMSTKDARNWVQQESKISGWTNHDLRRTARTVMSRLKIKHHIRERILNHKQKGIVGVYDQYDYLQEKADGLNKLAREIYRIIGKKSKPAKIVKLNKVG